MNYAVCFLAGFVLVFAIRWLWRTGKWLESWRGDWTDEQWDRALKRERERRKREGEL